MRKEEFLLILSSSLSGLIMGSNSIIISLYLLSLGLSALEIGELLSLGVLVIVLKKLCLTETATVRRRIFNRRMLA